MLDDLLKGDNLKYLIAVVIIAILFMCFKNSEGYSLDNECDNTTCDGRFCENRKCCSRGYCDCGGNHCISCRMQEDHYGQ